MDYEAKTDRETRRRWSIGVLSTVSTAGSGDVRKVGEPNGDRGSTHRARGAWARKMDGSRWRHEDGLGV